MTRLPATGQALHFQARQVVFKRRYTLHKGRIHRNRWSRWLVCFALMRQPHSKGNTGLPCHDGQPKAQA